MSESNYNINKPTSTMPSIDAGTKTSEYVPSTTETLSSIQQPQVGKTATYLTPQSSGKPAEYKEAPKPSPLTTMAKQLRNEYQYNKHSVLGEETDITEDTDTGNTATYAPSADNTDGNNSVSMPDNQASYESSNESSDDDVTQEAVSKIIKESSDVVAALESVAAMYCVPSSHILCDNTLKSIKVNEDYIIAPAVKNVSGNAKSIMCAIGAVLDYISQRIDDKIDMYQKNNIDCCKNKIIDIINKEDQLKYDKHESSYFNDIDDITAGMDQNIIDDEVSDDNENIIASEIQESSQLVDMYMDHNCTRNLGYELLKEQGFDYVKPTDYDCYVQESSKVSDKKKNILPSDIQYMKFDNKNIIDAIKYFNEARAEQTAEVGKVDIKKLIGTSGWNKAIKALNNQFDANIQIRFFANDNPAYNSEYTALFDDIKNDISISKVKGFQLNGLPIIIFIEGGALDCDAPNDNSLFGQNVVSAILHEMFHNIVGTFKNAELQFTVSLNSTMAIAASITNSKQKRIFMTNYVNTLDNFFDIKLNRYKRKLLVKQLSLISSVMYNSKALDAIRKSISESNNTDDIDNLIKIYERAVKNELHARSSKVGIIANGIIAAISAVIGIIFMNSKPNITGLCALIGMASGSCAGISLMNKSLITTFDNKYKNSTEMEEYYCDLFAAMYSLPVTFLYGDCKKHGIVSNDIESKKMDKLISLEKQLGELTYSVYPSTSERNHTAVKIAKNMLESDYKLDPAIKKYLQWIVDNYSSLLDSNIEELYNTTTFDPKEADDLDMHLENLIKSNNIAVTESHVNKILNSDKFMSE